jgi:prevent-host-death family protein
MKPASKATASVGIRDLKNHTSAILRRVRRGDSVTVTDRSRPLAVIVPLVGRDIAELVRELAKTGRVSWAGGKPRGTKRPPRVRGATVADAVIEDRR